jgi:hypothetical protein
VHAARHGLLPLKWLVDLDALCSQGTVDWERAKERASRLGWEDAVQASLSACVALLDTLVHPAFSVTESRGSRRFDAPDASPLQIPKEVLFAVRLLKPRSRQLRFLAARLFITPADCQFLRLPSSLFFLYYPLRLLRLACMVVWWSAQAGFKSLGRMFRD